MPSFIEISAMLSRLEALTFPYLAYRSRKLRGEVVGSLVEWIQVVTRAGAGMKVYITDCATQQASAEQIIQAW